MTNINTKLLSFGGVIGRRDYIFNCVIILAISLLFYLSFDAFLMIKKRVLIDAPDLLKFWIIAGVGISSLIGISNASRRLRDILGREDKTINLIVSVIIIISAFALLVTHNIFTYILFISHLIIQLILLFKKGKVTSELPYDSMREFNWAACITTWLWGLFNKSYITLFNLILFLTPWGVLFQIYCGLKGNEWALKNKKWENIEQFNKSQEKQTVFLVIFQVLMHFVVIPVIIFIFVMFCFAQYINPHGMKIVFNGMEKTSKIIDRITDLVYFESYEINNEINKFYIYPATWNYYSFEEKQKILNHAAKLSANKKDKKSREDRKTGYNQASSKTDSPKVQSYSEYSELPKTKIYNSKNNQLLGEYKDEKNIQNKKFNFWYGIKSEFSTYKFYQAKF